MVIARNMAAGKKSQISRRVLMTDFLRDEMEIRESVRETLDFLNKEGNSGGDGFKNNRRPDDITE